MCVVETWLGEEITDSEISLPDYQLYRLRHGGGVHIITIHVKSSSQALEFLLISLT